jgi:four helix bundle protein
MAGISKFTDLTTWQTAHKLVVKLLKILADKKSYNPLSDQMSRAAISITSNIAEGFARSSRKDKVHFYIIARGSITELQNQLLIARDTDFISTSYFSELADLTVTTSKLLHGLMKSTRDVKED